MDKAFSEFKQVEPLVMPQFSAVQLPGDCCEISDPHEGQAIILSPAEALAMRDWLIAATVGEGWKLVPVEPTPEMFEAWCRTDDEFPAMWDALLSAAPQVGGAVSDTDAENRLIVERLLGWTIWNSAGIEFVFGSTIQLSHYTFLTGDQMLLLLEAMAKRGLQISLAYNLLCWTAYLPETDVFTGDTAAAAVRAAALAVVSQN